MQGIDLHAVVIIDDIWSKTCFAELTSIIQAKACNSRIVISTRNSTILKGKDKEEFCLDTLNEKDAIDFFKGQINPINGKMERSRFKRYC